MKLEPYHDDYGCYGVVKKLKSVTCDYDVIAYKDGDIGLSGNDVDTYFTPEQIDDLLKAIKLARKAHNKKNSEEAVPLGEVFTMRLLDGPAVSIQTSWFSPEVILTIGIDGSRYVTPKEARKIAKQLKRYAAAVEAERG